MEPGHEDREYSIIRDMSLPYSSPQWSPVMKTGNTSDNNRPKVEAVAPQWSPVMKTGNTSLGTLP